MRTLKTLSLFTLAATLLMSCKKDTIHGSGNIASQERSLGTFEHVRIEGPIKANISYGTVQRVTVRTDAVALNKVETRVANNTLILDLDDAHNYQHISFEVDVVMPMIQDLILEGTGDSRMSGFQGLDEFRLTHTGVGDLTLSGTVGALHVSLDGVGNVHAFGFAADTCHVDLSGVGNIELRVNDQLSGSLSGVGNIHYQGQPTLNVSDTGVGSVIHVE
jgi:hypothetical protein